MQPTAASRSCSKPTRSLSATAWPNRLTRRSGCMPAGAFSYAAQTERANRRFCASCKVGSRPIKARSRSRPVRGSRSSPKRTTGIQHARQPTFSAPGRPIRSQRPGCFPTLISNARSVGSRSDSAGGSHSPTCCSAGRPCCCSTNQPNHLSGHACRRTQRGHPQHTRRNRSRHPRPNAAPHAPRLANHDALALRTRNQSSMNHRLLRLARRSGSLATGEATLARPDERSAPATPASLIRRASRASRPLSSNVRKAHSTPASAPRPTRRPVLARRPDLASIGAAVPRLALALAVSDKRTRACACAFATMPVRTRRQGSRHACNSPRIRHSHGRRTDHGAGGSCVGAA